MAAADVMTVGTLPEKSMCFCRTEDDNENVSSALLTPVTMNKSGKYRDTQQSLHLRRHQRSDQEQLPGLGDRVTQ